MLGAVDGDCAAVLLSELGGDGVARLQQELAVPTNLALSTMGRIDRHP